MTTALQDAPSPKSTPDRDAFDAFQEIVARGEPEAIIAFRPSPEAHKRLYLLIDREKTGHISEAEAEELNRCMELEHLIRMEKIQARLRVQERETNVV